MNEIKQIVDCGSWCLLSETVRQPAPLTGSSSQPRKKFVKIVFVLTLNGRQVRQVVRLLRTIYHPHHYYYIHVDSVSYFPLFSFIRHLFMTKIFDLE